MHSPTMPTQESFHFLISPSIASNFWIPVAQTGFRHPAMTIATMPETSVNE
jgi:hypothetical protein